MPARVVVVHRDPEIAARVTEEIQHTGCTAIGITDSMEALTVLETAQSIEVLVTGVDFPPGKPHGISVARMTRTKRPEVKILFTGSPESEEHTLGVGEFISSSASPADLVECVKRLLKTGGVAE